MSAWLSKVKAPYAWLSLDENDYDLIRFLAYLGAALRELSLL
jgi:ATP/maltotriose-dependent transcriptional regulator MalT